MRAAWVAVLLSLWACSETDSVRCGDLTCPAGSRCTDDNQCIPPDCGDGVLGPTEECDPQATQQRCLDFGYYGVQPAGCRETCKLDFSGCFGTCGDQRTNGPEACDGIPTAGLACSDFGFDVGRLACSSACTPSFELCSSIGWRPAAGGATNQLNAVWVAKVADTNVGFAVGDGGTVLRYSDGVWVPMPSPTTTRLNAVAGTAEGVIAVGENGVVLRLQLSTGIWAMSTVPGGVTLHGVAGTSGNNILAVGDGGTILRFDGTSWTQEDSMTTNTLRGIWVGPGNAFAVGDNGTLLRRGAAGWTVVPPPAVLGAGPTYPQLSSVVAVDGEVFVAGNQVLLRNDGANWTDLFTSTTPPIAALSVWGSNKNDIFFSGSSGRILHWDGFALTSQPTNTTRSIAQVHGIDGSRVVAATRSGEVLEFNGLCLFEEVVGSEIRGAYIDGNLTYAVGTNGGVYRHDRVDWTTIPWTLASTVLNGVWAAGADIYVAGVLPGGVYHKAGAADFVRETTTPTNGVWGTSARKVAVGLTADLANGMIHENTGSGWAPVAVPNGTPSLRAVWGSPDDRWFAVGDNGVVLHKAGGGAWTMQPSGVTVGLLAVWGSSATDVFAVGDLGTLVHWDGTVWRPMYTGTANGLLAVWGANAYDVYAAGSNGLVLHYDGIAWSTMTSLGYEVSAVVTDGARTYFGGSLAGAGAQHWLTRTIEANEERCQDPWDNDGKDGTNCDDPDCAMNLSCVRGGACETVERIDCSTRDVSLSTYTGIARIDDLPCLDHSTPGPEASYRFSSTFDGTVTVTMTEPANILDMVVLEAELGTCQLDSCRAATRGDGTQTITFDVVTDGVYYILIDGPVATAAPLTLTVTCP